VTDNIAPCVDGWMDAALSLSFLLDLSSFVQVVEQHLRDDPKKQCGSPLLAQRIQKILQKEHAENTGSGGEKSCMAIAK